MRLRQSNFRLAVKLCLLAAGLMSSSLAANFDTAWSVRVWQTDDGLPDNDVNGVTQMPEGWLYVATPKGLVKFDGVKFSDVVLPSSAGRPQPPVRMLLRGPGNELWLASEGGLVLRVGPRTNQVFTSADGLPRSRPTALTQTPDGAVWVGYANGQACRIHEGRIRGLTTADGLAGAGRCVVATDSGGRLWFAREGWLGVWDGDRFVGRQVLPLQPVRLAAAREGGVWVCAGMELFYCAEPERAPESKGRIPMRRPGAEPTCIYEDRQGLLWVGTSTDGVRVRVGDRWQWVDTSHEGVLALAEDREGNLWAGTGGGGLNRISPRWVHLEGEEAGLPLASLRSITEEASGTLWAVAQTGELARRTQGRWQVVTAAEGWPGARATCVLGDREEGVWVGTYRAGLYRWRRGKWEHWQRADGLGGDVVRGLFQDRQGALWIALEGPACVQRFANGQFQTFLQPANSLAVRVLTEDARGRVWLGTMDGVLLRVEGDQLINETVRLGAPTRAIRCLAGTPDGSLWIGYAAAGIGRVQEGRFRSVGRAQGLPDDFISVMLSDQRGGWWCAGDRGVFYVPQRELEAVADGRAASVYALPLGRNEGLRNLQANFGYTPAATRSRDGRLWLPMRNGLLVISPGQMPHARVPPPVVIEAVQVDGRRLMTDSREDLRLPPGHRQLEIAYTAFSFVAPESVTFRHRLEGWDPDWVEAGTRRAASYSRLPAGDYRFRVAARSRLGEWNPVEATLAFRVQPFVWQTWWFRVGALAGFALAVAGAVRLVSHRRLRARLQALEQETALYRERARIARDIHDDLGATLTQISLLGKLAQQEVSDPDKTARNLEQIAALARSGVQAVDEIVWTVTPRNDTVGHLLEYVGQYAVDTLGRVGIRCRVDFPEPLPELPLRADARHGLLLVLKEALTNVLKHAQAREVWIRASVADEQLVLSVEDDGQGFDGTAHASGQDGLQNMQERMAELGGEWTVESLPGRGTRVRVTYRLSAVPRTF
jgi:signal transduction histidine kinase/ligand-binding sensor domain-containing protein